MELNSVQNLMILRDNIAFHVDNLKDDSSNEIIKNTLYRELKDLDKQINYLHEYMKEISEVLRLKGGKVDYWHNIKAKVDKNEL